jgi:hypothetical protein
LRISISSRCHAAVRLGIVGKRAEQQLARGVAHVELRLRRIPLRRSNLREVPVTRAGCDYARAGGAP